MANCELCGTEVKVVGDTTKHMTQCTLAHSFTWAALAFGLGWFVGNVWGVK